MSEVRIYDLERVLMRYATALDRRDWPMLETCFWPDAAAQYRAAAFSSAPELVSYMAAIHRSLDSSLHRVTNVTIGDHDKTSVIVNSYVDALLIRRGAPGGDTYQVIGTYDDRLVRHDDEWRIQHRTFTALWTQGNRSVLEYGDSPPSG